MKVTEDVEGQMLELPTSYVFLAGPTMHSRSLSPLVLTPIVMRQMMSSRDDAIFSRSTGSLGGATIAGVGLGSHSFASSPHPRTSAQFQENIKEGQVPGKRRKLRKTQFSSTHNLVNNLIVQIMGASQGRSTP